MPTSPMNRVVRQLRRAALRPDGAGLSDGRLLEAFVRHHDDGAFEALVYRHGPMVWGVCRRVLGNDHDADDAFQASFLVLLRRAASVAPGDRVGHWLYGVAHRTALKAKGVAARRQARERQGAAVPEPAVEVPDLGDDLRPVL